MMNRKLQLLSSLFGILLFLVSCEWVKSGLSTEMEEELSNAIGWATIAETSWYYNGSPDVDVSKNIGEELIIDFSKSVKISDTGIVGSFLLTYYNEGSQFKVTVPLSETVGTFASDGKSFFLDMSPVVQYFDTVNIPSGTADMEISISGFLNNQGSKKNWPLPKLVHQLAVGSLITEPSSKIYSVNTGENTIGESLMIPTNGAVSLHDDAVINIVNSGSLTLNDGDLSLSASEEGIVVTFNKDFRDVEAEIEVEITGIKGPLKRNGYSQNFFIDFTQFNFILDAVDAKNGGPEITKLKIRNDNTNLIVVVEIAAGATFWEHDRMVLIIDSSAHSGGYLSRAENNTWTYAASQMTFTNGEADIYLYYNPGPGGGSQLDLEQTPISGWGTVTDLGWTDGEWNSMENQTRVGIFEFTISLSAIGLALGGDTVRVFAVASNYWNENEIHGSDIAPGTAPTDTANVIFDFNQALSQSIVVTP